MWILDFLFGKKPSLTFTKDGRVRHEHTEKKWDDWKDRFRKNPHYNFKTHVGTKAGKR